MDGNGLPGQIGIPNLAAVGWEHAGQVAFGAHQRTVDIRRTDVDLVRIVRFRQETGIPFPVQLAQFEMPGFPFLIQMNE